MTAGNLGFDVEAMLLTDEEREPWGLDRSIPDGVLEAQRNKVLFAIEDWVKERMDARYGWRQTRIHRDFVWARQDAGIERR